MENLVNNSNFIDSIIEVRAEIINDIVTCLDPTVKIEMSDTDNPRLHIESALHSDETQIVLGTLDDIHNWLFGDEINSHFCTSDYRHIAEMISDYIDEDDDIQEWLRERDTRYAVQNVNGQWWAGRCWGVEQAREEYDSVGDLPMEIEGMELDIHSHIDPLDAVYYEDDGLPCARVYGI